MLFNKKKRSASLVNPEVRYVTKFARTDADIQREARVNDYIKRAEDEYARLYAEVGEQFDRRDAGEFYVKDQVTRQLGEMKAIADSLSIIKGTDSIIEVAQLDNKSRARQDEVFPYTSFLSSIPPLYPEKVN